MSNEERVRDAIIEIWCQGGQCTQREVARATGRAGRQALSQATVRHVWTEWEANGDVRTQVGTNGVSGASYAFYWGARADATFREVLAAALQDGGLPADAQSNLRTAVRTLFGTAYQAPDAHLFQVSSEIPADEIIDLPARIAEATLLGGSSKRTAANQRSVVRRAMRRAAANGIVPVIFPRIWREDAWEVAKWAYFPNGAPGLESSSIRTYRCNWQHYGEAVRELFGEDVAPDDVTPKMIAELKRHLIANKGKRYLAKQVGTILSYVGKHHKVGPVAAKWEVSAEAMGYNGRVNAGYLVDAQGRAASDGDLPTFLGILRDNGLPEEWAQFFKWYHEYSTLPQEEVEKADDFPIRPAKRELKARTMVRRIIGIRAWGFQTLRLLEDQGVAPADITLADAFGFHGEAVMRALRSWWADRARNGEVSDRTSDGLVGILKAGMMVARALYDRSRHARGHAVVDYEGKARKVVDEEGLKKTAEEEAYWTTYLACRAQIDRLENDRRKSGNGHVLTTAKDLRRIIRTTPPSYWQAIQDELIRQVHEARGRKEDDGVRYHRLVMLAFLLGLMISCGFRISEVTHIRLGRDSNGRDRQYGPGHRQQRYIELRARDRKNERPHAAYLRERYCPRSIEEEYLKRSRPFFLKRGPGDAHDWLFVDQQGRPYGCIEEADDGSGRNDIEHASRVAHLRDFWIDRLMAVAASLDLKIPHEHGEFAPHVIRNVFGYLLYQAAGETDAANYLGDKIESVAETYASCDGIHVDVSNAAIDGLSLIKPETDSGQVKPSPAQEGKAGGCSIELARLLAAKEEGLISPQMFRHAAADLERRYNCA